MKYLELKEFINANGLDEIISKVICSSDIAQEKKRYLGLLDKAFERYGDGDYHFISSPGRSEIGGNHTDHQHGHVVAASLSIDNLVCVKASSSNEIVYYDPLFGESSIDISDLSIKEDEKNTSNSLIRGIAARLKELGYSVGGFMAICDSRVLGGSGISSSACFEVMICEIFSCLFNEEKVTPIERALISQYAENVYFGKPSGLLDQLAISVGGFVAADFKNPSEPVIENFDFSFLDYGYKFILVNTKGDHSDLSDEYAAVPYEIKEVAKELGKEVLADSNYQELISKLPSIREKIKNDRAILRSINFFMEDRRAVEEREAIRNKDLKTLLKLMKQSGRSSFMYLQNVYPSSRPTSQSLALALALSDEYLHGKGAFRVHGGGFEGTIQVILPSELADGYKELISPIYGDDALLEVAVRSFGTKTIV